MILARNLSALGGLLLCTSPGTAQDDYAWQTEYENLMVEVESVDPTGDWAEKTEHAGYAGDSYYEWIGANYYTQPGNGILTYVIEIHEEGRYELRFHNRHEHSDHTMENDCWVRMDGGTWYKLYSNGSGTVAQWNWNSKFEHNGHHSDAGWDLTVGRHVFEVSGRSHGFMIDRFNFYKGNPEGELDVNTPPSKWKLGANFCSAGTGSTGSGADLEAVGSISVADENLTFVARPMPDTTGILYYGTQEAEVPFGNGVRCVAGQIRRFAPQATQGGVFLSRIDFDSNGARHLAGNTTLHFQVWYRDPNGGGALFNLSNGLHLNLLP